ncbi:Gfo/Idh/MocA family protein [Cyclobacterium plantarum]|uniref:Gfo/Idh/MocA family oxidoreductase n=1 Tax=Cyclobacterium plantarum TaxID=2716263 RepID=A0ABX0H8C8_9BACT|nr:Gfo/Idh/MocA family oxidoreductase [Cyclobacterium plantarum]NHE57909.1 Gfo/Idh/MocA family oxidoreductase [Cyclobacterium plantarum]
MQLNQRPVIPDNPLPVVIIGAGGIVRDAHLPAYAMAKFPVAGIYDLTPGKAKSLEESFGLEQVAFDSLDLLIRKALEVGAVFDLAVPADQIIDLLKQLPDGSSVLIQKPMGENIKEAREILALCREKSLVAAVNFQLRHAPFILAAMDLIDRGLIGDLFDIEFKVAVYTPWELWEFLKKKPRVEILYHSIHYLDTVRAFWGDPSRVFGSTIQHPKAASLAATRSTIVLDYDTFRQARILTNHGHDYGSKEQESYLKLEGTQGAIKIQIGVSFDYPQGRASKLEYFSKMESEKAWQEVPLEGDWFPHAFMGPMASLQNRLKNPTATFPNAVEDAFQTMRLVEKLYESNEQGGLPFK